MRTGQLSEVWYSGSGVPGSNGGSGMAKCSTTTYTEEVTGDSRRDGESRGSSAV